MSKIKYTFREANNNDKNSIMKLYSSAMGTEGCTWSAEYPNEEICDADIARHDLFCMENEQGEIIASISIDKDEQTDSLSCWSSAKGKMAELSRLVVKNEFQNQGLAPSIVREVLQVLQDRGYKTVHYLVSKHNKKALASYRTLDFTQVGECDLFGEEWYCYEKDIGDKISHQIFTIPNFLSFFRLFLAGMFLVLYSNAGSLRDNMWAIIVLIISGVTDFLDGRIARRYHMISEVGKILDPIADKVTEAVIALCLIKKYKMLILMMVVFIIKETFLSVCGIYVVKKTGKNDGARWYGKVSTFTFYVIMIALLVIPKVPMIIANIMIIICSIIMFFSFVMYARLYYGILKDYRNED